MRTNVFTLLNCLMLLAVLLTSARASYVPRIRNAGAQPDFARLPVFFSSDPQYDAFVNEYFLRHLSVDERGVYLGGGPIPGVVDHMWEKEWDAWFLPWIDRGAMGLARQGNDATDVVLNTLAHVPVDRFGYCYGAAFFPEPNDMLGGYKPTFGWPWPKHNRNHTVNRPTGWEFNEPPEQTDAALRQWRGKDVRFHRPFVNHRLELTVTGTKPVVLTPDFETDAAQAPVFEIDIEYWRADGGDPRELVQGLRVYWTTSDSPAWSEDKSVGVDFCDLPPADYPEAFAQMTSASSARYPLYFPMFLHPQWGRQEGRRITGLKVQLAGPGAEGCRLALNYVRASYFAGLATSNSTLILVSHRFFMWSDDTGFLTHQMPRLRRAMLFLNEHLGGRREGLINQGWFPGHDGLGGEVGRSMIGGYWDLLPYGRYDTDSSLAYHNALLAMAALEKAVAARNVAVPEVSVIGPGDRTVLRYSETPESLLAIAARVKRNIERRFWVSETGRFCGNIDVNGQKHDYGHVYFNVQALAYGVGTEAQRKSVLSWLDGRVISGDTATGADIYRWRFAPRISTRRNESHYYWAWIWERERDPDNPQFAWGNQMQDGGAVPMTSLFELVSRCQTGEQQQIDRAFERTLEIMQWFGDVKAAGGKGRDFYRAYYGGHPERGLQQGGGPAGGLGLDREFLSDASIGTTFPLYAFLGVSANEDGVLTIAPALPSKLEKIGVSNVFYRGNHLTIEAGRTYVSLKGSSTPKSAGLSARVLFRRAPAGSVVQVDGKPAAAVARDASGGLEVTVELKPCLIELIPPPLP